jgi:hypothetical protein
MRYAVDQSWPASAPDPSLIDVVALAVDADDNVYAFNRGPHPVVVFDTRGVVQDRWGEGVFSEPHGLHLRPEGEVYCVDYGDHTVRCFGADHRLRAMLGTPGVASDTGAKGRDWTTIKRAAGPFNAPTDLEVGPDGDLYVSDGYANARIHRFAPDGTLRTSWGTPGSGPGEFQLPHSIMLGPDGLLHVSDRENSRIQRFTLDGEYVSELGGVHRPNVVLPVAGGYSYIAELGYHTEVALRRPAPAGRPHSRVTIYDADGQLVLGIGGPDPTIPGSFAAAHSLAIDSQGSLYVGDVGWSANPSSPPKGIRAIQKFVRES